MYHKTEQEVMGKWKGDSTNPLVSILCITYNHEKYIEDAIKGFLMQESDFSFEIIIHDDASTDGTADIIRKYEAKYPKLIKPIYQTKNQFSQGLKPGEVIFPRAKGKYIALCDGDDYWCDKDKLQKQVEYLEKDEDCVLVHHDSVIVNEKGKIISKSKNPKNRDFTSEEMLCGETFILTNTAMLRNINLNNIPNYLSKVLNYDIVLWHWLSSTGYAKYQKGIQAAYRIHSGGAWSQLNDINKLKNTLEARSQLIKNISENSYAIKRIQKSMEVAYYEALQSSLVKFNCIQCLKINIMILLDSNISNFISINFYFKIIPTLIFKKLQKTWVKNK